MTLPADWKPNSPNFIATEQVIWKNNVMTGIIHRNVAETQVITNLRVLQNDRSVSLGELDDIIVMNQHRESQSQGPRLYTYNRGFGTSYGYSQSSGKTIGDVVFMYGGQPVIIFKQITDPHGVCRLAKTARRSFIAAAKAAEKVQAKLQKEKEKQLQNYTKTQPTQNRPSNRKTTVLVNQDRSFLKITCNKCGDSSPPNSNFCVKCGNALSSSCSKCGFHSPTGSAFCNNCGFALA